MSKKKFLALIDKHFPIHNRYSKIFNRNSIKISYSCTPNMKSIITSHNKTLSEPNSSTTKPCNCRRQICPLNGECRTAAIVYKATAITNDENETMEYIGSTETEFKLRHANHKHSFNNILRRAATKLSQHVWNLKSEEKDVKINWEIQRKSRPYMCGARKCDLCTSEKYEILKSNPSKILNRRTEIANKCRHRTKFKLRNLK